MFNESKEKFRSVLCCFAAIKNIAAPSSSSHFSMKLICSEIVIFGCLDKYMPMSL